MRVLVTRPAAQAREWVHKLRAAGVEAEALPLIGIAPAADAAPVHEAWASLGSSSLVFFVSPNAVLHFFALRPEGVSWPEATWAASPGPGTTLALAAQGVQQIVEPAPDAEQFDSEALWQRLRHEAWTGRRVTIVRGSGGRDWLADRLREAGAEVAFVAAYERAAPRLDPAEAVLLADARARPAEHLWFFSSSEAIDHLEALCPGADWSTARAIATHPRIAERAARLGIGRIAEARPAQEAVMACIQSFAS